MAHLGYNVYLAQQSRQNRFLVDCLAPAVDELRRELPARFWFSRFDARGPHLFVVVSLATESVRPAREKLSSVFAAYLSAEEPGAPMPQREIEERHAACRGKALCAVDREETLADNGSFASFEQPATGYPYFLSGSAAGERVWEKLTEQSLWCIGELARVAPRNATASALHWLAGLDRELPLCSASAADYWQYHVGTLLPHLRDRLAEPNSETYQALLRSVGKGNRESFERTWNAGQVAGTWSGLPSLVAEVASGSPSTGRWALLREIVHTTLLQLGLPVALHLPPLVFCWERSRSREEEAVST